jgi:hypothetical protein
MLPRRESRHDHCLSIVFVQGALRPMPGGSTARNFRRIRVPVDGRRVLGGNATDRQPQHQNYDRGFPEISHDPILMLIWSPELVTLVQGLIPNRARTTLRFLPARSVDENPGQPSRTFWQHRSFPAARLNNRQSNRICVVPAQESCRFV